MTRSPWPPLSRRTDATWWMPSWARTSSIHARTTGDCSAFLLQTGSGTRRVSRPSPPDTSQPSMKPIPSWPRVAPTSASWPCEEDSGADVVELAGVQVETVDNLPECRHRFQPVAPCEWWKVIALAKSPDQGLITLHQRLLAGGELYAHRIAHQVDLRSPAVPITIRSSWRRLAFSSKRGKLPSSAFFTPNRSPSCASEREVDSFFRISSVWAPSPPGISTSTSLSSWRPSAVSSRTRTPS